MSREQGQILYNAVDLVTPRGARQLGLDADKPTFISRITYPYPPQTTVYQFGAIAEGNPIIASPDLKTALIAGGGFEIHYTGFVVVGEVITERKLEHIGREANLFNAAFKGAEKMRVIGFKAFVDEQEVRYGHVNEFIQPYNQLSELVIDTGNGRDRGRERYAFRVTYDGNVLFQELGKRAVKEPEEEEPLSYQQIMEAVARGEVVRITRPLFGINHSDTRPNDNGGYISLAGLTKQQIMLMYQDIEDSRRMLEGCQ